jgi:hypothetical protein
MESLLLCPVDASPKKHRAKKVKAVPPPVEKTAEEIEVDDRAKMKRKLAALHPIPTPKQVYTTKQKECAIYMLTHPSQCDLNKPDDEGLTRQIS